ncbi:MAG: rRNA pseudouridine synthase [Candidatus Magasanikbacteria bacterium CG10_big_fil_rev_8_21_14_0_10_47_10]|uniref:Pseudouridine synthase n=1 Tax=Candidatus Magasanikbacteria bacterium CG10_big_fil_rev_8_21_14_0_10_47_10 TaxID=1974652 RepID=A0A2H0TQW7_9BACT|nr:MAG: rRNA pseudouridine synthase [Candidatus Magasanikbacteria bacterium CG10_big_fil_rev_8_21_14_0_10_47_10]
MRLQKHIADCGVCSRRKAEEHISAGNVAVNGKTVTELGTKIDPAIDTVTVAGKNVQKKNENTNKKKYVYIILNKPTGYITSASSEQGASVLDLITRDNCVGEKKDLLRTRVYPVGRLDKDSEGLVLLTNDGELTNTLTHPKYEHEKEYDVTVDMPLRQKEQAVLEKGMIIDDAAVQGIVVKEQKNLGRRSVVTVVLKEGKNRQIRKMFGALGYSILSLKRTRMGRLKLGVLPIGRWRYIRKDQIIK